MIRPFLPTPETPLGFLQPFHEYIIDNTVALKWSHTPHVLLAVMPLGAITYLAQLPNTRPWRMALAALGISILGRLFLTYRFVDSRLAFFNVIHTVGTMHLLVKYLEYGLMTRFIVDPRVSAGKRSLEFAGLDLAMNSRMIGLGATALNTSRSSRSKPRSSNGANGTNGTNGANGASRPDGSNGSNGTDGSNGNTPPSHAANDPRKPDGGVIVDGQVFPPQQEKQHWLPPSTRTQPRLAAVLRHARIFAVSYVTVDTLLVLLWRFGSTTIASPGGQTNAFATFLDKSHFVFLPQLQHPIPIPRLAVEVVFISAVGMFVYIGLQMMYHLLAVVLVGSGIWEVESFDVDFMDSPWKADSLLDLWGRRWHQFFRHHFLMVSSLILRTLHLPLRPALTLPLVFLLSGGMHAMMVVAMDPVPNPIPLGAFFVLSGLGAALEATFRQVTGKRVGGFCGRLWTWTFAFYAGRGLAREGLESGLAATMFVPEGKYRPGLVVVHLLTTWVFDTRK